MMDALTEFAEQLAGSRPVRALIQLALDEDIGEGDVTSELMIPSGARARGRLIAREEGIVCGFPMAVQAAAMHDDSLDFQIHCEEGANVEVDQDLATIIGPAASILTIERLVLNILQRMSGIATETQRYVDAVDMTDAVILETRKTVPGWRLLDKYAVRAGGGQTHRMGLFDQILAKENHFALARREGAGENFETAIRDLVDKAPEDMLVEVEVENLDQFEIALDGGVDIILLDNMSVEDMAQAAQMRDEAEEESSEEGPELEASGGITLESVAAVADAGVDRISIGAITHSPKALDISLLVDTE